jgi:hypothetical protein
MLELFNPAGLRMLEELHGAIAFGYVAPRVLYARFVGRISSALGDRYVQQLAQLLNETTTLAYFADASALREHDASWRAPFERLVRAERGKFASIVFLTPPGAAGSATRALAGALGDGEREAIALLGEPLEFERALCNVAPFPDRTAKDWAHVWQVHAPRWGA